MSDGFFGELYLRSTLPFLDPERTKGEVAFLAGLLAEAGGPLLDLGCGHGRHAAQLAPILSQTIVGLDVDPLSLASREEGFLPVLGDLRALPFHSATFRGAYAWYSTLFVFTDEEHPAMLAEIARVLRPGAPFALQTVPFERLAEAPAVAFHQTLPDGSVVREESRFDPSTGRDQGHRTLTLPDGKTLEGRYSNRYYREAELVSLLQGAGFEAVELFGGLDRSALGKGSRELVAVAKRRG